jgi:uncharacterized protein YjbJ (UPF0337 family)
MNKDQVKGHTKEVKGKAKEVAGELTDDKSLKYKGKAEQAAGKIQSGYGDAKNKFNKNQ